MKSKRKKERKKERVKIRCAKQMPQGKGVRRSESRRNIGVETQVFTEENELQCSISLKLEKFLTKKTRENYKIYNCQAISNGENISSSQGSAMKA